MRFIHTADWHLGKFVNDYSMLKDQQYYLDQLLELAVKEQVELLIISGDIYDRSVPPAEAVSLLDDTLHKFVNEHHIAVALICGNHDGSKRLSFGSRFFNSNNLFINSNTNGEFTKVTLNDSYGPINFYLIPYIEPIFIRKRLENDCIKTFNDAFNAVINEINEDFNKTERNIAIAHGFFSKISEGKSKSEVIFSESEISIGGSDLIDANCFNQFDYTALGHLHAPQKVGSENIRYSGSMLKYSVSEAQQNKCVYIIDIKEKNQITIEEKYIKPLRDLRIVTGSFDELCDRNLQGTLNLDDYVFALVKDDGELIDAANKLRSVFPNLLGLKLLSSLKEENEIKINTQTIYNKSIIELFSDFFKAVEGEELSEKRMQLLNQIIEATLTEEQ